MIIRDAADSEMPYIREQRISSYREHAEMIPEEHWNALRQAISSEADAQTGVERKALQGLLFWNRNAGNPAGKEGKARRLHFF